MTITVGTDTYATIAEADAYAAAFYLSDDSKRTTWDETSTEDKEILLRRATQSIEQIRFPGKKCVESQELSFPRDKIHPFPLRRIACFYANGNYYYPTEPVCVVPDDIKAAEIEEALEMVSPTSGTKLKNRMNKGVSSVRIGSFSESFTDSTSNITSIKRLLNSIRAQELISSFSNGSFRLV